MAGILATLMLCLICYQDLKQRAIHLFVFIALALTFFAAKYWGGIQLLSFDIILNCFYVFILMIIILLYFRMRFGSWDLFKVGLGIGDFVFWLIVGLYLNFQWFVIWFNVSMIFALIGHFVLRRFRWYGNAEKIPLAGLQAMPLIIYILLKT